ncbi:hypothetical protein GOV05_03305 [Candidatus Woesearchaeota archaeon]|nr:hypothetical protein [Candidatus Woesearchaeota archaeon]
MGFKKIIISLIILVLLSISVLGVSIGVSPAKINYEKVLKGGYASRTISITTDTLNNLSIYVEKSGSIAEWVSFGPIDLSVENITITRSNPYRLDIIIMPPDDVANGNYTGSVRVVTDKIQDVVTGKGSAVKAAFLLDLRVEITGEEIIGCVAGGLGINNFEVGEDIPVFFTVENTGNVKISPEINIEVFDLYERLVEEFSFISDELLPTTQQRLIEELINDLIISQYFAKITIPLCNHKKEVTFTVVEPGGISDEGELLMIKNPVWAVTEQTVQIVAVFKNLGERTVRAKFTGVIKDALGEIIKVIDTDSINVKAGETQEFPTFFKPENTGQYFISGKINYNDKLTFEKASVLNVNLGTASSESEGKNRLYLLFIIIVLLLLITIRKKKIIIRRKKRRNILKF